MRLLVLVLPALVLPGKEHVVPEVAVMLGPLPRTIRTFRRKYPSLDFRLTEMASSAILEAVRNGAADLGLLRGADQDPAVRTQIRWKEPMVAILPNDFSAPESPLAATRLRNQPFVFFPRHLGPSFYDETIAWSRRAGFVPQVAQEARQWSSIMSLVAAGMGVSIGPESIAGLMPKAVRCVPLQGFTTTVRLVSRTGEPAPAVRNFVRIAGEALRYN